MAVHRRSVVTSTCRRCLVLALLFERCETGVMTCRAPLRRSRFWTTRLRLLSALSVALTYGSVSIATCSQVSVLTAIEVGDAVLFLAAF
jgi:hypothetical protein